MKKPKLCSVVRGSRYTPVKRGKKLVIELLGLDQVVAEVYSAEVGRDICAAVNCYKPNIDSVETAILSLKLIQSRGWCEHVELLEGALDSLQQVLDRGFRELSP